jgi:hypothetical protein
MTDEMFDEINLLLQKVKGEPELNFPFLAFEKLCKFCLTNSPDEYNWRANLEDSFMYKMSPFVKELCSSENGIFSIFLLLEKLDPRWGIFIGEACYNARVSPVDLMTCLQSGPPEKALPAVLLFCTRLKDTLGAQFTSAFIDALNGTKNWDAVGLSAALMLLDTTDKAALPALAGYKQKLDAAVKKNTGKNREAFVIMRRQVQSAMAKIEGRQKKWWQFWK